MLDVPGLLRKHRGKGVLVDANLLVLLLVGTVNRRRLGDFKRTQSFTAEDFDLLRKLIAHLGPRMLATPHVLSQVSDLTDLKGRELLQAREVMKALVRKMEETYHPALDLVEHPLFTRFGRADAAVAAIHHTGALILTADLDLYIGLQRLKIESLNFHHIRMSGWK